MKIALFAYSRQGCHTAARIRDCYADSDIRAFTMEKFAQPEFEPITKPSSGLYGQMFDWADLMVFVSACGIAVRQIAPFIKDKTKDPAVLCLDERAAFVIPLLSGHIGGANEQARKLAEYLDAVPVVTTATDINGRFSVDTWAARNGFLIADMKLAKDVSAAILERDIPIFTALPVNGTYPAGTFPGSCGELGIVIGWETISTFDASLRLIPRALHLGIGCRKGTSAQAILQAVTEVLNENGIDPRALGCAASIDMKAEEQGLLESCREMGIPVSFYTAQELLALEGNFSGSDFVRQVAGVDCVCERSAMMGAERILVPKTVKNGVTVAVAAERCEVHFG